MTTHFVELTDPFDATHLLIILLQLSSVTSYFDVYSPIIKEYENEDIPKIHLTAEKPPWDPSMEEYLERETWALDCKGQISTPATAARGSVYVSALISYSLADDTADVMDNDNLVIALSAHIQISVALINTVRNLSVEPIIFAKGTKPLRKVRRLYKSQ